MIPFWAHMGPLAYHSLVVQIMDSQIMFCKLFYFFMKQQIFKLVQIESSCRLQIKCGGKIEICFGKGRKHCEKRRKCWLPAFFSFSHNVFKRLLCWGR